MQATIFAAVVVALVALYWHGIRRERRTLMGRFADRPSLNFDAFYRSYYAGKLDREKVEELLNHVAQELSIPPTKLLPSDRFDVELRPARGWEFDSGKGILLVELDSLARKNGKPIDTAKITTLDDYLVAMAEIY